VVVLDVGVATDLPAHLRLRNAKVRSGTDDLSERPGMTREEAARAILAGAGLAGELIESGVDLLISGDMGIANTTPAACLIAVFTGREPQEVAGRGTGIDNATWDLKVKVIGKALRLHTPTDAIKAVTSLGEGSIDTIKPDTASVEFGVQVAVKSGQPDRPAGGGLRPRWPGGPTPSWGHRRSASGAGRSAAYGRGTWWVELSSFGV
jgi:hypothetical protein